MSRIRPEAGRSSGSDAGQDVFEGGLLKPLVLVCEVKTQTTPSPPAHRTAGRCPPAWLAEIGTDPAKLRTGPRCLLSAVAKREN